MDKDHEREAYAYAVKVAGPKPATDETNAALFVGVATVAVPAIALRVAGLPEEVIEWPLLAAGAVTGGGTYAYLRHRSKKWGVAYFRRLIELEKELPRD